MARVYVSKSAPYSIAEQLTWNHLPAEKAAAGMDADLPAEKSEDEALFPIDAPAIARVIEVTRLTSADADSDVRRIVFDIGDQAFPWIEGQSLGVLTPLSLTAGQQAPLRLYSIASPRMGEDGAARQVSLCVKRVTTDERGAPHTGLCSNYLCDLKPGDRVRITGPFGRRYLMPDDPQAPLLLISTGTGIAPARAMIERRLFLNGAIGAPVMLAYGARTPADMPYWTELSTQSDRVEFYPAFSRLPDAPKKNVQDILRDNGEAVFRFLENPATHIFLCGLKNMEQGVLSAFSEIFAERKLDWERHHKILREQHRLHIETY